MELLKGRPDLLNQEKSDRNCSETGWNSKREPNDNGKYAEILANPELVVCNFTVESCLNNYINGRGIFLKKTMNMLTEAKKDRIQNQYRSIQKSNHTSKST